MKFLRIGKKDQEIPVALDKDGKFRNLSSHVNDLGPDTINFKTLERLKIANIDFVDWIKQEYNTDILNSSFKSRIEWKRTANDLMEFSNAKNKR